MEQLDGGANLMRNYHGMARAAHANTVETGPGVRFRVHPLQFTVNFLRGAYLVNQSNPYRPNFNDIRIGVWYAFTH